MRKVKKQYDFGANPYQDVIRVMPEKKQLLKDHYKQFKKKNPTEFLDYIIAEFFTPNLFKQKK